MQTRKKKLFLKIVSDEFYTGSKNNVVGQNKTNIKEVGRNQLPFDMAKCTIQRSTVFKFTREISIILL